MKFAFEVILLSMLLLAAGCATTVSSQEGVFRERLGSTSSTEAVNQIREALQVRYSYSLDREVVSEEEIRFLTTWKEHTPFSDEESKGITACRTRIEVQARPKDRIGGNIRQYTVHLEADYQTKTNGGEWKTEEITESREEYLQEIADYMENEFKGGTRSM